MIDGVRLGKATCIQFRHNDMNHLEQLLDDNQNKFRSIWILSESLFSMDGDYAPLTQLIALKKKYQAYLYLDEAHAVACIGENGLGLADQLGVIGDIDLLIGTFGKALAGYGGYVAGDRVLIETMENFARSWIFSTSLPPITMDWNYFIWQQLRSLATLRTQLAVTTQHFRDGLHKLEQNIRGTSHIVPLLKPGNAQVIALAAKLEQAGILVIPIRSPTEASGSERLRFSLTASMPIDKVQQCLGQIERAL